MTNWVGQFPPKPPIISATVGYCQIAVGNFRLFAPLRMRGWYQACVEKTILLSLYKERAVDAFARSSEQLRKALL